MAIQYNICWIENFAVPAEHRVKIKEIEKKYKYIDLARELKKIWTMMVTLIPIVVVHLEQSPKD